MPLSCFYRVWSVPNIVPKIFKITMRLFAFGVLLLTLLLFSQKTTFAVGILDRTFGNNGIAIADFGIYSTATNYLVQPDGKILVVGYTYLSSSEGYAIALARFDENGGLDNSFGNGGKVITNLPASYYEEASAVALQPDGKIIIGGRLKSGHI